MPPGSSATAAPSLLPWAQAAWPGEPRRGAQPAWHAWFSAAWQAAPADGPAASPDPPELSPPELSPPELGPPELGLPELGLLEVARPLIAAAGQQLADAVAGLTRPAPLAALPGLLTAQPPMTWLSMSILPAMAAQLAEAREQGQLAGADPRERYAAYVTTLADRDAALAVWRRYPVLARQVSEILANWVEARISFARHLAQDLGRLGAAFAGNGQLGELSQVRFGAAETHRHGRTVALAEFTGGTVVYKPRDLAIDQCFDRLLHWFNASGPDHALRRLTLLDRGDHGWSEQAAPAPCTPDALPAYFWRLGALLALTHLVRGFDLHADNVIAVAGDPVVVDLEALFHTELSQPRMVAARLGDPAAEALASSVLKTGLLPGPLVLADIETERPFGVDISPMGVTPSRRSLIRLPALLDDGTDLARVAYQYREVAAPAGRLAGSDGLPVDPERYRDELVAGFTAAYQRLHRAQELLLAPGGPLAGCARVPVRLVQLSTFCYNQLLTESWQPAFLREAADRDRVLSRLSAGWPGMAHRAECTGSELAALRRGDVPVFTVRPGSRDIWLDDGTRLPDVLPEQPLTAVTSRLAALGGADLAAQVQVIDAALATGRGPGAARDRPSADRGTAGRPHAEPDLAADLLAAARQVAAALDAAAVRRDGRIGWITSEVVDARQLRLAPAGLGLYSGLPGIGLFLSYLAATTGDQRAGQLAGEVAAEVMRRCAAASALGPAPKGERAGGFGVLAAPVYYLAHAAVAHGRPDFADFARSCLVPALEQAAREDRCTGPAGLAEGPAGWLVALLALHAAGSQDREPRPGGPELRLAASVADALAARYTGGAEPQASPADTGPAYGPVGTALALARWHEHSGDPRAAAAVRTLLRAEPALSGPTLTESPTAETATESAPKGSAPAGSAPGSARTEPNIDSGVLAGWCQGAAGIGLVLAELAGQDACAPISAELGQHLCQAIAAVIGALPRVADDSLCHGRLGMVEMLASFAAAPQLSESPDLAAMRAVVARQRGWLAGRAGSSDGAAGPAAWRAALPGPAPGLLPGLAGFGLGLIRLARPQHVPQILLLAPPRRRPGDSSAGAVSSMGRPGTNITDITDITGGTGMPAAGEHAANGGEGRGTTGKTEPAEGEGPSPGDEASEEV